MSNNPFGEYALTLLDAGFYPVLLKPKMKTPAHDDWNKNVPNLPLREQIVSLAQHNYGHNIGVAAGTYLKNGDLFAALDIDTEEFVPFVTKVVGVVSGKIGANGLTIFVRASKKLKSAKFKLKGKNKYGVELMINSGMLVMPPSNHPNGMEYRHHGRPLHEVTYDELPELTETKYEIIKTVFTNEHAWTIVENGATVQGHESMLALTASGVANLTGDLEWLAECLNALFHPDYKGNTREETLGMLRSAKAKKLGVINNTKDGFVRDLLEKIEVFPDTSGKPYITIVNDGAHLTYSLESITAKRWISREHYSKTSKSLSTNSLNEIVTTLSAIAIFEGKQQQVFIRLAPFENGIVIDLGNKQGEVVVVNHHGWSVKKISPVKFERPAGMEALPIPDKEGIP